MDLVTASSSGSAGKAIINGFADLTISGLQISTSKTVIIPNPFDPSKPIIFDFGTNGRSGDVTVTGLGSLTFDNTIINSATQGNDPAGNISITSPSLINFQNNSQIKSTTNSTGNAGNISFTTGNLLLTDGVKVSASTAGSGKAGDISVKVNNFTLTNGASIETKTSSSGDSGKIEVIVGNNLILVGAGTGLFADTTPESTGRGGSIFVDPPLVSITNGAGISVNSLGKGNGGNINIFADKFIFANNAFLRANTASGEGGNINLQIANIFFPRNNSSITATAAGTGNGGNITLSALFLVSLPSENNDIFANAFLGKGGNINITTQGIFGLAFRPRLTSLSDITASSDFGLQGSVTLNTPGVDPSQGLNTLPADIGDASKLVSQKCLADRQSSSFVITGRGGIPASPFDTISAANIPDHLGSISNQTASNNSNGITAESSNSPIPDRIVEAQGWMINAQGQILFIAEVPAIPATVWSSQPKCISVSK
jgi:large exoprotein involved in heme utilization and adhesion